MLQHPMAPGVDRTGPVAVLIDQADVLQDAPVLVVGLERHFVLIHLADLAAGGLVVEEALVAVELVAAEVAFHAALERNKRFLRGELDRLLGPPGEEVAGFPLAGFVERFHPQQHVDADHFVVGEEEGAPGAPNTEVAGEPAPQAAVELDAAVGGSGGAGRAVALGFRRGGRRWHRRAVRLGREGHGGG